MCFMFIIWLKCGCFGWIVFDVIQNVLDAQKSHGNLENIHFEKKRIRKNLGWLLFGYSIIYSISMINRVLKNVDADFR